MSGTFIIRISSEELSDPYVDNSSSYEFHSVEEVSTRKEKVQTWQNISNNQI